MSKAEIIAELSHLSAEDLAEIRAQLDQLTQAKTVPTTQRATGPRIRSPRLAKPAQAGDFKKQVLERGANAAL